MAVAPAGTNYGPAAISWTGSAVIIAAVNADSDLYYWYQPVGTGTWHQQEVAAGSVAAYYNPAIAWTGSSVVLAGVSANGSLNFWWQAAGTSPWHEEHVATFTPDSQYFPPSIAAAGQAGPRTGLVTWRLTQSIRPRSVIA